MVGILGTARRIGIISAAATFALAAPTIGPSAVLAASPAPAANVESVCPPASPGHFECLALRRTDVPLSPASSVSPGFVPSGYGPADLQSAYNLPSGSAGSGLTVAIVDAYDLPTAEADLAQYRAQYSLPACTTANGCFRKVDQSGGNNYPPSVAEWGLEIALDIDMVSATCPNCNILLVEASSSSTFDLGTAVDTAVSLGAIAVSNSYGGPEYPSESVDDVHFNHPGVAITVASGDCGYNCSPSNSGNMNITEYPSASRYVVSVGGTSLIKDSSARGWSETAWGNGATQGAGSGCSLYESKPTWQHDAGCAKRMATDVSAVADPATGVAVYRGGWSEFGGTSAASPIIAATYALAGAPAAGSYPASYPYSDTVDLNDAVGGTNVTLYSCPVGNPYYCSGVAGYDGPTGLGTPNGVAAFTARSTYHPVTPARILDSRTGIGGLSGKFSTHVARTFQVTGHGGVPAGATAVTGNVTATQQSAPGYLSVGPVAQNNPSSSTLNFPLNDDRANEVTVALGGSGTLSITYVGAWGGSATHVLFDVTGYFTADTTGVRYFPLAPARVLDTRDGTGGISGQITSQLAQTFQVTGSGGVPPGATAVTGNLTVTQQSSAGYLYLGPLAVNNPTSSSLNFPIGDDRANAVTVALGSGQLGVTFVGGSSSATADVVFDVTGYFLASSSGARYVPIGPVRLMDSRDGTGGLSGPFNPSSARTFSVTAGGFVPAAASAVTGNLTVTQQGSAGYLFLGPIATNTPGSSTLNFPIADDRANAVTVALGAGSLSVTYVPVIGATTTHAIFDLTGYFVP